MTQFDLEQQILACWSIIEDIKLLNSKHQDEPGSMSHDEVANYLLGLETIYGIKFDTLFNTFEKMVKNGQIKNGSSTRNDCLVNSRRC